MSGFLIIFIVVPIGVMFCYEGVRRYYDKKEHQRYRPSLSLDEHLLSRCAQEEKISLLESHAKHLEAAINKTEDMQKSSNLLTGVIISFVISWYFIDTFEGDIFLIIAGFLIGIALATWVTSAASIILEKTDKPQQMGIIAAAAFLGAMFLYLIGK